MYIYRPVCKGVFALLPQSQPRRRRNEPCGWGAGSWDQVCDIMSFIKSSTVRQVQCGPGRLLVLAPPASK